jgi:hypothetical protein
MSHLIPNAALLRFVFFKRLAVHSDGSLYLVIYKGYPDDPTLPRALKIVENNAPNAETLRQLSVIQSSPQYPLVHIHEGDKDFDSYATTLIRGLSVRDLINESDWIEACADGLPPFLVFHILESFFHTERYLQIHDLHYHDVETPNFMLHFDDDASVPRVTLVDFRNVCALGPNTKWDQALHVFRVLAENLIDPLADCKVSAVRQQFRRRKNGGSFNQRDLKLADQLYVKLTKGIGGTLMDFWSVHGVEISRLALSMRDDDLLVELKQVLKSRDTTEADIKKGLAEGGLFKKR